MGKRKKRKKPRNCLECEEKIKESEAYIICKKTGWKIAMKVAREQTPCEDEE